MNRSRPIYATTFDDPADLEDWRLEGGSRMVLENGKLVLESNRQSLQSESKANHLVCWLEREIPADFCLEFTVRPENRQRGLNIIFFNTRGVNGQPLFDPSLAPRDGTFVQYHSGDLNGYHISYWAAGRESSNLRKNKGFHLLASGRDLIASGSPETFQQVQIYKRGGLVRLSVDGQIALEYTDDGQSHGPVHTHSGWIGLRQMAHTQRCEYDRLAVYPLKNR